jgi:pimeloyl-ACP methyl ester carboxylesterase
MATITTVVETEQFLDDPRFSQSFELPADPQHGRDKPLNVTYADFGYRDEAHPETERVLFFFPGMFASRWLLVAKDHVAKQAGVRIVTLDRPGFGGTTTVSPEKRLEVCRGECTLKSEMRHTC